MWLSLSDDLEKAEDNYEKAKKELEVTLAELNEIWAVCSQHQSVMFPFCSVPMPYVLSFSPRNG